jgi:hypothetical protein
MNSVFHTMSGFKALRVCHFAAAFVSYRRNEVMNSPGAGQMSF